MSRRSRLLAAAALSTTLSVALAATVAGAGGAAAAPEDTEPVVTFRMPDSLQGWSFRRKAYVELGLHAVTGEHALEIRSKRPDYSSPITTTWTSGARTGTLPVGIQKNFRKLHRIATVRFSTKDGELVEQRRVNACFNLWYGGARVRPGGDAANPYPQDCPRNPFTVGSVQGIPGGWAIPVLGEDGGMRVDLRPGRYDVTVELRDAYAESFGIPEAERSTTSKLVVHGASRERFRTELRTSGAERDSGEQEAPGAEPAGDSAGTTDGPRPDLRSLPAFEIGMNRNGTQLRFAANVWNAGPSPLLVDGFRRQGEDVMDAYQYFFDADGNQVGYERVGELHYHGANHQHWHFEDFARYRLLDADKQPVARSRKVSFCLANTDAVDYTVPGADWRPEGTDLSTACGSPSSLAVREVLSSGSGDTYFQYRRGQALPIRDLPNGVYYISVEANPFGRLLESDTANNTSLRKIRLRGEGDRRRVKVPQVGVIKEGRIRY